MIYAEDLVKYYGTHLAVDHINLQIEAGRIVGMLGLNGAGKTTTLRMLACFMPATSGRATINGHDIFKESMKVRQSIGYLSEQAPLYHEMTVQEQIHFFGRLHGMDRKARQKRIGDLTASCGLQKILNRPIGVLSKGNRQRVGLAQALIHDPPIVFLDEPTAGLDPTQITEVRKLILGLADRKTILLSTHILPEVEKTCQDVVIIAGGQVVAQGSPQSLKQQMQSSSRTLMEIAAPTEALSAQLNALPNIAEKQITPIDAPWVQLLVKPKQADEDLRPQLSQIAIDHQWPIRELRHETASLEAFFIQVTSGQHTASSPSTPDA